MSSQKKKKKKKTNAGGVNRQTVNKTAKNTPADTGACDTMADEKELAAAKAPEPPKEEPQEKKEPEPPKEEPQEKKAPEPAKEEVHEKKEPEPVKEESQQEKEPELPKEEPQEKKSDKKLKGAKKAVLVTAIVLFVLLLLLVGAYFILKEYINQRFLDKINYETPGESFTINEDIPTETPSEGESIREEDNLDEVEKSLIQADAKTFFYTGESAESNYVTNILLIGSDVRPGKEWNGNSDAMILISINNKTKKIVMTSFMRDMYVYIPIADTCAKLNSAHAYGGSELLCQTITGAFKIKIDKYVRVDFYGLMDIIDAAGGVDMYVTEEELPVLNQYITDMCVESGTGMIPDGYYLNQAGSVHLSGMQAVAYARIRYVGNSDFERTNRQRKVLNELISNCKSMSLSQITRLADVALPKVSTNMTQNEIWDIINDAIKYMGYEVVTQRVPFDGTFTSEYINYQQVILPDYVRNVEMMINGIYGE